MLTHHAPERRSHAPHTEFSDWRAADGWPHRTLRLRPEGAARGTVVFLNGRADFLEKYLESYAVLVRWGYAVASLDWRGQGMSGRLGDDPHKGHLDDFDILVADLAEWVASLGGDMPGPFFLVAHSMGAHIGLRCLAEHPGLFRQAVLLAPMLGIRTGCVPAPAARRIARWMVERGQGGAFAFGQKPHGEQAVSPVRQAVLTGDRDRFADEIWWVEQNPALALGGVTWGWLDAAFRSLDRLAAPGYLQRVTTPVLILMPEHEQVVDPAAARSVVSRLPEGRLKVAPGGRHELLRDVESVRNWTLAEIRAALEGAEGQARG